MDSKPIALVTGANRGIGRAIALGLAGRGYHVVLGVRRPESAEALVKDIKASGGSADTLRLDVADRHGIEEAGVEFGRRYSRLDALVNNAGVMSRVPDSVLSALPDDIERALKTNMYGPLFVTRTFARYLRRVTAARVVNVSSRAGQLASIVDPHNPLGGFEAGAYRLSKASLNAVTALLAKSLRADGILVNAMCPGWVRTDMGGADAPTTPEEGADTAIWLATLPPSGPTGGFFAERQAIAW
ncbi:MAG TPA: SDR family NAD(P)-dependent oxidoreductase [Albitalea sp.]|nr:SDR family NAD(P)-dependent oxidoreductase [Albitalea sp.]